jgi:hypothetical protein
MLTKKEWSKHLRRIFKSNLSIRAYTRENDISYETFRLRILKAKACKNESSSCEIKTDFIPVQIKEPSCSSLEIKVNEVSIIVKDNFNTTQLQKIISILREC